MWSTTASASSWRQSTRRRLEDPDAHGGIRCRKIIAMGGGRPGDTDVAVRDDRVSAVGTPEDVAICGGASRRRYSLTRFSCRVSSMRKPHMLAAGFLRFTYVGYHDRAAPRWFAIGVDLSNAPRAGQGCRLKLPRLRGPFDRTGQPAFPG